MDNTYENLSYCPHCKDITSTEVRMYKMSFDLLKNYPDICTQCNKDKNVKSK